MVNLFKESQKGHILIISHSQHYLNFFAKMLTHYGYFPMIAENDKTAFKQLKPDSPDLILLDIFTPRIDDYQFCNHLKSDPKYSDIPVIFMSQSDEILNKIKAFEVGAIDYIHQPFIIEELMAKIDYQIRLRHQKIQLIQEVERLKNIEEILSESRGILLKALNSSSDGIATFKAVRDLD